ncbi:uncharacterized protein MONOS_11434 [Monocercomonoides exilis]|uniref:uncharacterized protein n=1 Tax=Monocercomonoides exilis TaxID=2049356 RepID=UPI00355AAB58|nr:hypothetical protein MONOS_11434 [Monocercomonoides exilis]|eukprot:MONOS_11434.1-p1 / transcript=MONOS_11434.1 / gene=MONOS_11434 / organism=Monocercomonoides_exilis_PA203 / gene_product=unspecified product / transcript_product=unspecified product / location=Mono_scaffold00573:36522-37810(-) / protein_length=281 / sequence_SO=supercontig / SO=protein_coding / is_pseudo=false
MEMGRGAVGAPITLPSTVVVVGGEGGVTLGVMRMKDLNKEVTKRGKWAICVEDDESACVCSSRLEADKNAAGSDECAEEWAEAEQGGSAKRNGDEVERLVARQRGSRRNTQKGKERSRERITSAVSEGERDKNIQSEQCSWTKRCLSFSKLVSFFMSQNSMAMDLMQKYPTLNFVAPFDSAADFAANTNIALHPLSHCTSSLVNSSLFMNIQQQSFPSLRTSQSPSLFSQAVHPSSANSASPGSLSLLSLPALSSSPSLSFSTRQIHHQASSFIPIQKHR